MSICFACARVSRLHFTLYEMSNEETFNSVTTLESTHETPARSAKKLPWQKAVAQYQQSDMRRSLWQMLNSIAPFFILWYLAYRSLTVSYALTLAFAVLAALFVMRIFIIFHDCGHG